ncbi:hypothetical protein JZ751_004925 [Albula glossodonta]|uniref:Uncharacterized protein n=1 Tax=Albula glossodonta TaxID=121402 RepID=A0A8T2PCX5_9TELE|nr:hypothetical protein JZ751_004925 [Albula glossodonta]
MASLHAVGTASKSTFSQQRESREEREDQVSRTGCGGASRLRSWGLTEPTDVSNFVLEERRKVIHSKEGRSTGSQHLVHTAVSHLESRLKRAREGNERAD